MCVCLCGCVCVWSMCVCVYGCTPVLGSRACVRVSLEVGPSFSSPWPRTGRRAWTFSLLFEAVRFLKVWTPKEVPAVTFEYCPLSFAEERRKDFH